ncbi:hypothetical protein CMV_021707 [Castanea mollissima]|uniref:Uncharacterized protein n=1 Tax=Castanea mollissima TaxID=60419 RepID=A0A8J4QTQ0_9ROSI|nr:hypothetical protein CMV_021707 [Castanea mollissima]
MRSAPRRICIIISNGRPVTQSTIPERWSQASLTSPNANDRTRSCHRLSQAELAADFEGKKAKKVNFLFKIT